MKFKKVTIDVVVNGYVISFIGEEFIQFIAKDEEEVSRILYEQAGFPELLEKETSTRESESD